MDLRHHIGVWFRWKWLLIFGVLIACALAVFVSFRLSFKDGPDLKWRGNAQYSATSRVFITQPGFPWGRVTLQSVVPRSTRRGKVGKRIDFADPARFGSLAVIYSYLIQSDQIRQLIHPVPDPDQISAISQATGSGDALPLLQITTRDRSPAAAADLNNGLIDALRRYLDTQFAVNKVKAPDRVVVQVINPSKLGTKTSGHTPTLSVVAFVLVLAGVFLLVYVLENLYPPEVRALRLEESWSAREGEAARGEAASPSVS